MSWRISASAMNTICRRVLINGVTISPGVLKQLPVNPGCLFRRTSTVWTSHSFRNLSALDQQRGLSTTENDSLKNIKDIFGAEEHQLYLGSKSGEVDMFMSNTRTGDEKSELQLSKSYLKKKRGRNEKDWERLYLLCNGMIEGSIQPLTSSWNEVENYFSEKSRNSAHHWSTRVMKTLATSAQANFSLGQKYYEIAQSLLSYAKTVDAANNGKAQHLTVAMLCYFVKILGSKMRCHDFNDADTEKLICDIYGKICEKTPVLDSESSAAVIQGLTSTSTQWRKSLELIEEVKLTGQPRSAHYSPVIAAAIRLGHIEEAWTIIDQMVAEHSDQEDAPELTDWVFAAVFDRAAHHGEHQLVTKLLNIMQQHYWIPSEAVAIQFIKWFQSIPDERWTATVTKVTTQGRCMNCGKTMASEKITPDQFLELRDEFLKRSLKREDIFLNTTPEELKKFQQFLDVNAPFDLVLDGLNIALQLSSRNKKKASKHLVKVIEEMVHQGKRKLLVLARRHVLKQWPKQDLDHIHRLARVFYTTDISSDDPYMLYAALYSGSTCQVLTVDMLRDHRFLLKPDMRARFKAWQRTHQITFSTDHKRTNLPRFQWPKDFATCVQRCDNAWHIPYEDGLERQSHELPNAWICLQQS